MKKITSLLISLIPINSIRIFLLRVICGYQIDYNSSIGMFNVIISDSFIVENSKIGMFNYIEAKNVSMKNGLINKLNRIKHLNKLTLAENSIVFSNNFIGGSKEPENRVNQNLILGLNSEILRSNYFDVVSEINIGNNVVFGGEGSEIWTHGYDFDRNLLPGGVTFGDNIFIGSKCVFTKNISICNKVTIGPGSVIYKSIKEPGFYTTHQIVKVN
jgi:UDP-3-O-[3-hydroxymyristoyl] glucosamine N-acyltransferase